MIIELTKHAKEQIIERKLKLEWIAEALVNPIYCEPDQANSELTCTYGKITDNNNQKDRVLKVVYKKKTTPCRIITCYFDRKAKRKLLC